MAKAALIVEDENDKFVFEAIIRHIKLEDELKVVPTHTYSSNIDYKSIPLDSSSEKPTLLIRQLKSLLNDFSKETYDKVGIIRDMDNSNKKERLLMINNALKGTYSDDALSINDVNEPIAISIQKDEYTESKEILFSCHFVNLGGKGEIENILKAIKAQPSQLADCVNQTLPDCLNINEEQLREKDLVKLWFNNYQRYDTLRKKQRRFPYTSMEYIMLHRTQLFDFNKDVAELTDLKNYLTMMST